MLVLQLLKSIPFFESLTEDDHLSIIENIRLNYFPEGHTIFKEGDPGDMMFIIRSGKVKIFQEKDDHERTITVLSENEVFGEMALISDKPRNASVKTLEECEVFSVHGKDLYELLQKKPEIAEKISDTFVRRSKENDIVE